MKQIRNHGFTLIELMAVVAIIGLLASVAIPAFSKYMLKAKSTEASLNLRKVYDGQVTYYYEEFADSSGKLIPKQFVFLPPEPPMPPVKDKRPGNFQGTGWQALKFGSDSPVYYTYMCGTFTGGGGASPLLPIPVGTPPFGPIPPFVQDAFQARALGDLDGDGKFSLFERTGYTVLGNQEVQGFKAVFSFDELE